MLRASETNGNLPCLLCAGVKSDYLGLGEVTSHVQAHPICIKFAKEIQNKKSLVAVGKTRLQELVKQCENIICVFCSKPGAASGCWKPYCPVQFHYACSLGQEVVNRYDIFMSSCWAHSRRQRHVSNVPGPPSKCGVCGWTVSAGVSFSVLVTTCCNNKHHRDCIQVLGNLGVENCPSCSNVNTYKSEMVVNGIHFNETKFLLVRKESSYDETSSNCLLSSPLKNSREIEYSLKDSGISLSSPLETSTPIFDENDKNLKRKSINEPDPCSSTKRQKSISINGDETEIDFTLLELRPRKLRDNDLCDGSVIEIDENSIVEEEGNAIIVKEKDKESTIEETVDKDISMSESETDFAEASGQQEPVIIDLDDSYSLEEQLDYSDILSDNEEVDDLDSEVREDEDISFNQEDVDTFNRENSPDMIKDIGLNQIQHKEDKVNTSDSSDEIESTSVTSIKEFEDSPPSSVEDSSPSSVEDSSTQSAKEDIEYVQQKSLSEDKLLAMKRKEVLKRIKKLPISKRFIVHGRNLLPWNQKVENYCEYTSEWMDNYDDSRVDDIIDLNAGEKCFFKLWNQHIRLYSGLGNTHMPVIVMRFIESSGVKILERNLFRNLVAHLSSLERMEIIGSDTVLRATLQLQKLMRNIHIEALNNNWRIMFRNERKATSSLRTPRRRAMTLKRDLTSENPQTGNKLENEDERIYKNKRKVAESGEGKDEEAINSSLSMPTLSDQSQEAKEDGPNSPEMPLLMPELIKRNAPIRHPDGADTNTLRSSSKQKLNGRALQFIRKRKLKEESFSHFAAGHKKKKSGKVQQRGQGKSEIEFAIKSHKKNKFKMNNKFTPIKRKLRKNFKFYNEQ